MFVTPLPIVTLASPLHPENADSPMLVTLSDITTFVIHAEGNTFDILEEQTRCGIVTLVSPTQSENAVHQMLVTLSGIVTLVRS